ncbi:MAG: Asp-tRNA(Asn)/Glu-tRNA(Gln) amidotransferase subunit GatB [Chloroflexi bacterium]|nr:Asp-tRNA(Asn)/Glu-tRNA(Gln) amidotransferase subunit GatB [Chloroflexota bacterium]MCL5075077.1 Asp-tRNA(Asn)/Glu-tRNA(Gln) amidotransferase subunit GatB [Chloroflexota bacterium]
MRIEEQRITIEERELSPYEVVIGLEVHAQLLTKSKMFCGCSAQYAAAPPNTLVCPICLGMPGVLPTINRKAIEYTIMTALALNCSLPEVTRFDRKNYPYPDLMKGYQISQYALPISQQGWLMIEVNGQLKRIGINHVHLEEDTAKLLHHNEPSGETYSLLDVNRSGVPLMEIVSEPDLRSAEETRLYLIKLRNILRYLGVSTGNMEEGSFRCDANISVRPWGGKELGSKVEIKNMNSFRAVYRALSYEAKRQMEVLANGGCIEQETRGWVEDRGVTVSQRSKEYAHDYRYFSEPDLPPLILSREWIEEIRQRLPELPDTKWERFKREYGLSDYDAGILTSDKSVALFFESCLTLYPHPKPISNWIGGELFRLLNASGLELEQTRITPDHLAEMLRLIDEGVLSGRTAKMVFEEMFYTGKSPALIVKEQQLAQVSDAEALRAIVERVLADYPQGVADYRSGKTQALGFLVGQVMRATEGKANPALVNQLLRAKLDAR